MATDDEFRQIIEEEMLWELAELSSEIYEEYGSYHSELYHMLSKSFRQKKNIKEKVDTLIKLNRILSDNKEGELDPEKFRKVINELASVAIKDAQSGE